MYDAMCLQVVCLVPNGLLQLDVNNVTMTITINTALKLAYSVSSVDCIKT